MASRMQFLFVYSVDYNVYCDKPRAEKYCYSKNHSHTFATATEHDRFNAPACPPSRFDY